LVEEKKEKERERDYDDALKNFSIFQIFFENKKFLLRVVVE